MADHPRPSPSPQPNIRPELEDEPKTDPRLQAVLQRHDWKNTVRSIIIAGGALIGGICSVFIFIDNRVAAQTDAGVKVHETRISNLEQQQAQLKSDVHEVQTDIRALYKAVMTGRPQERLERPPSPPNLDGGSR